MVAREQETALRELLAQSCVFVHGHFFKSTYSSDDEDSQRDTSSSSTAFMVIP